VAFADAATAPTFDGDPTVTAGRIRVDRCEATMMPLHGPPQAQLSVALGGKMIDGVEYLKKVSIADAVKLISPDARLQIFAQIPEELGGGLWTREYIFEGYPTIQEIVFNDNDISLTITCTSLVEQLGKERKAHIWGRHMKPIAGYLDFVESMPTIFNRKGKPNRAKLPITVGTKSIPVFTYDGDPDACYWTYADVLTYLLSFYWEQPFGTSYPLFCAQGMDMASAKVGLLTPDILSNSIDPAWKDVVGTKCEELVVHGRGLVDALILWCRFTGGTMQQITNAATNTSELVFALNGDGGPWKDFGSGDLDREIRRAYDDTPPAAYSLALEGSGPERYMQGRTISNVIKYNEVKDGRILSDVNNSESSCAIASTQGELYEVTAGKGASNTWNIFKPGWRPDTTFGDNDAVDLAALDLLEKTTDGSELTGAAATMFARYVRGPDDSASWAYASVGRLWVLNEAGEYLGATYGRTGTKQARWPAGAYTTPFNFHTNCNCPLAYNSNGVRTNVWFPRRRKMLPPISKQPDGLGDSTTPPRVVCSFDSGATWMEYPGSVRFAKDQCAMMLTDANLAKVKSPKPPSGSSTQENVWRSICLGTFRIAATFSVESDSVCFGSSAPASPLSSLSRHRLIISHEDFLLESRTGANSELGTASGWTGTNRDDTSRAISYANRYVSISQRKSFSLNFSIPWLTKDWLPGDLVTGLTPIGADFRTASGNVQRWPQVIKTTWINSENGQATQLQFDDRRTDPRREHLQS
jgi:hypothetical protein